MAGVERHGVVEPRVVILDVGGSTDVTVLELPVAAGPGTWFWHLGGAWRVVGFRPRTRVLVAERDCRRR